MLTLYKNSSDPDTSLLPSTQESDSSALDLATFAQTPGFTGTLTVRKFDNTSSFKVVCNELRAEFASQNVTTQGCLTVKVAAIEATVSEVIIETEASPSQQNDKEEQPLTSLTQAVSDGVLVDPHAFNKQGHRLLKLLQDAELCSSMEGEVENYVVEKGKIISEKVHLLYNASKNPPTFLQTKKSFLRQMAADKNISSEILEKMNEKMFAQYPLFRTSKPCKVLSENPLNSCDILLSQIYSLNPDETAKQLQAAIAFYQEKSSYTRDILQALTQSVARGEDFSATSYQTHEIIEGVVYTVTRQEPLKIIHCQTEAELKQYTAHNTQETEEIGGYYSVEYNVMVFTGNTLDNCFLPYFIHEATHAMLNKIFNNDSKPYFVNNQTQRDQYELAKLGVFKAAAIKLGLSSISEKTSCTEVIEALKQDSALDLIYYKAAQNIAPSFIDKLKQKYDFKDEIDLNILKEKLKTLQLSESDFTILRELAMLIFGYPENQLDIELIVRIPQLFAEKISDADLSYYFKPLMAYWDLNITTEITKLFRSKPNKRQNENPEDAEPRKKAAI